MKKSRKISSIAPLSTTFYVLLTITILLPATYYILPTAAVPTAHATSAGLATSKTIMDIEVPPGSSYSDSITIFNNSTSTPLPVHIDLLLWNLKEDADDIEFIRAEEGLNATKWFEVSEADFILEPGKTRKINYTISPPASVSPGSYFVMMRFRPTFPEFYFAEEGPRFIPEIGTLFFLKVAPFSLDGEAGLYGADITSLEPGGAGKITFINNLLPRAQATVFDGAVKTLVARIANTGIFHFKASGVVEIKNMFGRTVAKADFPERYLLPNRERPIETIILPPPTTEGLPFLQRFLRTTFYLLRTNMYFGPYSATVTLSIPETLPVTDSVNFWVIPWQFWLIVIPILFGIVFLFRKGRKIKGIRRIKLAIQALFKRNYES